MAKVKLDDLQIHLAEIVPSATLYYYPIDYNGLMLLIEAEKAEYGWGVRFLSLNLMCQGKRKGPR